MHNDLLSDAFSFKLTYNCLQYFDKSVRVSQHDHFFFFLTWIEVTNNIWFKHNLFTEVSKHQTDTQMVISYIFDNIHYNTVKWTYTKQTKRHHKAGRYKIPKIRGMARGLISDGIFKKIQKKILFQTFGADNKD